MLKPFIYVMNHLNYHRKFLLIALLFLVPLTVMSYSLTSEVRKTINIATKEQHGTAYLKPLQQLLLTVQKHRGQANAYLNGDTGKKETLGKLEAEWNGYIEEVSRQTDLYGDGFGTSARWSELTAQLAALQKEYAGLTAEQSFAKHTTLIEALLDFNIMISDASELTLDPEQHTYYLMDMIVQRLPLLTEKIGKTRGQVTGTLLRGNLSPTERIEYMIDYDRIETALTALEKDWASAVKGNADINEIEASYQSAFNATREYVSLLNTEIISGRLGIGSDEFFARGTEAIDHSAAFYNDTSDMMVRQLQIRIDKAKSHLYMNMIVTGAMLLLVIPFFLAFYRNVLGTIRVLEKAASQLAAGDASARAALATRDELQGVGTAFNRVADAFASLLRSNQAVAAQLAASSSDMEAAAGSTTQATNSIAQTVQELTAMAEQQSSIAEQNATAMSEMAEAISRIAETASAVSANAEQASSGAAEGRKAVDAATEQMAVIRTRTEVTAAALSQLGNLSGQIGEIAAVMTDLAAQTHLLSLNANIEAARAGEHGRGFAIVAQEVQKLSEQSRRSADEIAILVQEATSGIERASAAMDGSTQETSRGIASMEQVTKLFDHILEANGQVAEQIGEVSAAAEQISASTEQVAATIQETSIQARVTSGKTQEVSASTEEQLASMEEVLASSESLNATAGRLHAELSRYTF